MGKLKNQVISAAEVTNALMEALKARDDLYTGEGRYIVGYLEGMIQTLVEAEPKLAKIVESHTESVWQLNYETDRAIASYRASMLGNA